MPPKPPPGKPPKPPKPPKPSPVDDIVTALENNTEAIRDQTEAGGENTEAIVGAINRNTAAILELVKAVTPPVMSQKATSMRITTEIEPESSQPPPGGAGGNSMPTQLYPNQKFKGTIKFNGVIDGEPTVVAQGPFVAITQDPKIERPATDDANRTETVVTIHGRCTQPDQITGPGPYLLSFPTTAVVDDPATANNTEEIFNPFADQIEWIPTTQPKATGMSMVCEIEP